MEFNPLLINRFVRSKSLRKTKTDSIDALMIAQYLMTVEYKPYLLFSIEGIKQLLEQRKPLAVILERPRGCDDIAKLINNGAVVLEF